MSEVTMSISEQILLEKCIEIELLCKDLYEYFAELYSDNEDAVRLWRKTAIEEQNHADQFTLALKLRKGLPCMVVADAVRLESVLNSLHSVLAKVKAEPPELKDALNASIKLENHLAEFHLTCVVLFEIDSYRNMFNAMMLSDQEHIGALEEMCNKLTGEQDWTFTG